MSILSHFTINFGVYQDFLAISHRFNLVALTEKHSDTFYGLINLLGRQHVSYIESLSGSEKVVLLCTTLLGIILFQSCPVVGSNQRLVSISAAPQTSP